jgi:L-iditol 2-dehydrogenase
MKAVQIDRPKHLRMVEAPVPRPAEGQVLVRNLRLSICGSDMRSFRRVAPEESYPFAPGQPCHECLGVVEESRAPGVVPGQRVIALPLPIKGVADYGGGGEYLVTNASRLIPLPQNGDPTTFVMCQPVGTVLFSCQRMGSVLGKRVVILGQGAIGLTFTHLIARMGASQVVVVDPLDYRLAHARRQGATTTLNPLRDDVVAAVAELTEGQGADVVVEAAGTPETVNQAPDLVRRFGTIVLFGLPEEDVFPIEFMKLARKQPTVIPTVSASSDDPTRSIKDAVSLVAQGRLDVSWLVTHRLPFREAPRAYELYEGYLDNVIKVVMEV